MSKKNQKTVIFTLAIRNEIPFTQLSTSLKRFSKLRQDFESLGLRVEVVNFK